MVRKSLSYPTNTIARAFLLFLMNMQTILHFIFFSLLILPILLANYTTPSKLPNNNRTNETDYHALLAIKAEISDDPNSVLSSWNNSHHFCEWEGVTCGHRHNRVIGLRLSSCKLAGTVSPFIGNLSFLQYIYLSNNTFRGDIPRQVSHLPRLQILHLSINYFEGEIPANLSRCLQLKILILHSNNLVGRIPVQLATLPNLVALQLNQNSLSGHLRDIGIGNFSSSFRSLYLHENHLDGNIPDDIGRVKGLQELTLGNNLLYGIIPTSLFNLSNLDQLYLSNVNINGHLPQDLGLRLPRLSYLNLANTNLVGNLPTSLSNLSMIEDLFLSNNSFSGSFPLNGNNLPYLSRVNIASTFTLGEARDLSFVETLTNCTNLEWLEIGDNSFTRAFPHSILNLSATLDTLGLDDNQISGHIPLGLNKFVNMSYLYLSDNLFTG